MAAILARRERRVLVPTVLAILLVLGAQVLFWTYTYPANKATANWTVQPDNWLRLRQMWEYSHLAGACLQLLFFFFFLAGAACGCLAMACLIVAVMSRPPARRRNYHVLLTARRQREPGIDELALEDRKSLPRHRLRGIWPRRRRR